MHNFTTFDRFIAIDYSGSGSPTGANPGISVWAMSLKDPSPQIVEDPNRGPGRIHWSRHNLNAWLVELVTEKAPPTLIGIDHGFAWPVTAMPEPTWDRFLHRLTTDWGRLKTDRIRAADAAPHFLGHARVDEERSDLRLTEKFSSSAKSVFHFDGAGVALSTLAGLPWLAELRADHSERIHFWPFDGWEPDAGKHCVVEIYPSLFSRRYPPPDGASAKHAHDAAATCQWMKEAQQHGWLGRFFKPCLTEQQRQQGQREGWILGIM